MFDLEMLSPQNCAIALIDFQPAMYQGVQSHWQFVFELRQDWARTATYEGVMNILRAHSPYGIQVRFSKWALGPQPEG